MARSVQQRRVSLVNQQVVPYLSRISEATRLTDVDREEARELAQSIRSLLVADVERGWAQEMLNDVIARVQGIPPRMAAHDPDDAGSRLTPGQRTLLRAIAIEAVERVNASAVVLTISECSEGIDVRWDLATPAGGARAARVLKPVLHLVRGLTSRSRVDTRPDGLALEFHYGH